MSSPARLRPLPTGEDVVITRSRATIGRGAHNTIVLDVQALSRTHAEIEQTDHGYVLRDNTSRNGTFVNGRRLTNQPEPLRDGDEIVLAGVVTFRFVDPSATPIAPAIGRLAGVWIDVHNDAVWVDGQMIDPPLSARQHALLVLLDQHVGSRVSRSDIVESVWSDAAEEGVTAQAIDSLIKRLRARIRPLQMNGELIDVARGRGVKLRRQ